MPSSNVEDKLMITILWLVVIHEISLPEGHINKDTHNWTGPLLEVTKQIHAR